MSGIPKSRKWIVGSNSQNLFKMELGAKNIDLNAKERVMSEKEFKRQGIFNRIRYKLMAMAMAGLLALGSTKEVEADQLRFDKKEESVTELVLEPAITGEKLRNFEEYLKKEEPEFLEWVERYEAKLKEEVDGVTDGMLNFDFAEDRKIEDELRRNRHSRFFDRSERKIFSEDHDVVEFFKDHPEDLNAYQEMLKGNLREIILSSALIDQSPEVREKLMSLNVPSMVLKPHDVRSFMGANGYIADRPYRIVMTPRVFLDHKSEINSAAYLNFIIHEIVHTLHRSPESAGLELSILRRLLLEGMTQNITYEIIQFLQSKDPQFKNVIGYRPYDDLTIIAVVMDAIAKSYESGDAISKWSAGLIDDDELVQNLKKASENLKLDPEIINDLDNFRAKIKSESAEERIKFITTLLARLENSGLYLPPDFIEKILIEDREVQDRQRNSVRKKFYF